MLSKEGWRRPVAALCQRTRLGDGEARDRAALLTKFKSLTTEAENLRMRIDEESDVDSDDM